MTDDLTHDSVNDKVFVNRHKIAGEVEIENIGFTGEIVRDGTEVMTVTLHTEECAFTLSAGIGVIYKEGLKQRGKVIEEHMLYYPVTELRGIDLPLDGIERDEAIGRKWLPAATGQVENKIFQLVLGKDLEVKLRKGVALILPGIEIATVDVFPDLLFGDSQVKISL